MSEDLISRGEVLRLLRGTLNALSKPDVTRADIQRCKATIAGCRVYLKLLAAQDPVDSEQRRPPSAVRNLRVAKRAKT